MAQTGGADMKKPAMNRITKIILFISFCAIIINFFITAASAQTQGTQGNAPVIINNNNGSPQSSSSPACAPANQNDIYDSRVPPAGAYYTRNPDGSGMQTFTTGEKKPYITDNNCGGGMSGTSQPQVVLTPPTPPIR